MADQQLAKPAEEEAFSIETFSSPHIKVEAKRHKNCRVVLEIEGDETIVKEAKKKAVRDIAKEVSIPGFRKGKAPAAIIEKKFPEALKEATEKAFADKAFMEGGRLANIPVLNGNTKITFKMISFDDHAGKASFSFESEPSLPSLDFSKFRLPKIEEEKVDEAKVDETIDSLRMFYATWNQIEERGIQEGDFVVLDIDDLDQNPPVKAFSNARFEVKPKKMAAWMEQLVLGKKVGESVEGVSKPDPDESEAIKKEFKQKKVRISIKTVEEPVLPELNDEFALRIGAPTVSEMKRRIKMLIEKQEKDRVLSEKRIAISDQISELFDFEIPASIIEQEANHRMAVFLKQPQMTKKWNEEFSETDKEEKKREITEESKKAIRLFYICRKIALEQKIRVTEDELSPSYESLLDMMFADPAAVNYKNQSKQQQAMQYSKLMMAKAQDYIIAQIQK